QQTLLDVGPVALLELRFALAVGWFGALERELVQTDAIADGVGALQPANRRIVFSVGFDVLRVDLGLRRENAAELRLEIRPRVEKRRQLALAALPFGDHIGALQRGQDVFLVLERVGEAEDLALQHYLVLGLHRRILAQQSELQLEILDRRGN